MTNKFHGKDRDLKLNSGGLNEVSAETLRQNVDSIIPDKMNNIHIQTEEIYPNGQSDYNWRRVAVSPTGRVMLAAYYTGRLFASWDYGVTWTEQQPAGNVDLTWNCLAIDQGSFSETNPTMIAGYSTGKLYLYKDSVWTEIQPVGAVTKNWKCAAIYSNWILVGTNQRLYSSNNYGTTWVEQQPAGNVNKDWKFIETSLDNRERFVAGVTSQRIYIFSTNGVTSWTELRPNGDINSTWVNVSFYGIYYVVINASYEIYLSEDEGVTWKLIQIPEAKRTQYGLFTPVSIALTWFTSFPPLICVAFEGMGSSTGCWVVTSRNLGLSWNYTQVAPGPHQIRFLRAANWTEDEINLLVGTSTSLYRGPLVGESLCKLDSKHVLLPAELKVTDVIDSVLKKHTQNTDLYLDTPVTNTLHVDNKRTDTYIENGSITKPFKTIQAALDSIVAPSATNKHLIEVSPGSYYSDPITINKVYTTFRSCGAQGARISGKITVVNPTPDPEQITFVGLRLSGGLECLSSHIAINTIDCNVTGADWVMNPTVPTDDEYLQVWNGMWTANVILTNVYTYLMGGGYYSTFVAENKEFNINNADINTPFQVTLNGTIIASAYGNRAGSSNFILNAGATLNIDADTEGGSNVTVNPGATLNRTTKASNVNNDSSVTGVTVKNALETLDGLAHNQNTDLYLNTQVTNRLYVDCNRSDVYVADGGITKPFKTIQAAINASAPTDINRAEIEIMAGRYVEHVTLKPFIVLCGCGANSTIIEWNSGNEVVLAPSSMAHIEADMHEISIISSNAGTVGIRGQDTSCININDINISTVSSGIVMEGDSFLVASLGGVLSSENAVDLQGTTFGSFSNFIFNGNAPTYYDLKTAIGTYVQLNSDCMFMNANNSLLGTVQYTTSSTNINNDSTVSGNTVTDALDNLKITFVNLETPGGFVDGINNVYTLAFTPIVGSVEIHKNGLLQTPGVDYTISGLTITFGIAPLAGSIMLASYRK